MVGWRSLISQRIKGVGKILLIRTHYDVKAHLHLLAFVY